MSTLNVANITDGTDTVETGYVINGSAKAWVNFNGTGTVAIRDSLNAGSITDHGTGEYSVNNSSAFSNTNYNSASYVRSDIATPNSNHCITSGSTATKSTSAFRIVHRYANAGSTGVVDSSEIGLTFHGDLA